MAAPQALDLPVFPIEDRGHEMLLKGWALAGLVNR